MWGQTQATDPPPIPADALIAIVPFNLHSLRKIPDEDLEDFRNQLWFTITNAFAHQPDPPTSLPDENHGEIYESSVGKKLGSCCATCGGWCCLQGAGHAFIEENTIHRYRYHHPDATPEVIFEDYFSRIGDEAYQESCVYHGPQGCRLPRELRAAMCNQFRCRGLIDLLQELEVNPHGTGIIGAADEHEVRAVGSLSALDG